MEMTFGRPAGIIDDWHNSLRDTALYRDGIIYLPGSSAGSPSFSPAFSSFWNDTSIADRVVGRFGKKYGTAYQDKALTTATAMRAPVLFRQYVIPLASLGTGTFYGLAQLFMLAATKVFFSSTGASAYPTVLVRLFNAAGTLLYPNPTLSGITVPASGGSNIMVSSGGFSSGDLNRAFYFDKLDNTFSGVDAGPNTVSSFVDSSHVHMSLDYVSGSNTPGSSRTLKWLNKETVPQQIYGEEWFSSGGFSPGSYPTSPVVMTYGMNIPGKDFWPHLYLIAEFGMIIFNASISRTYTIRFGDPSDVTFSTDPTNGSAGVDIGYLNYSRTMSLNF